MKACINYISSRNRCIKLSIKSLWDNFNYKYDYPVYVYYFDDIYDSEDFRDSVKKATSEKTHFISVPYETPLFLKQEELFYNRKDIWYAKNSFPIARKGYLHMCNFTSNMYGYENTEFYKYDYIMTHDDESGYTRELPYDPFEILKNTPQSIGAYSVGQRLRNGAPHQGHLDTRVGLWNFTKNFLLQNELIPKTEALEKLIDDPDGKFKFHLLNWCDTYVIKTEMFKSELWQRWIEAVNDNGGIYKYRWGDNEIITLFAYIYGNGIHNFKTVEEGYHNQGMFRQVQDIAPNVKDVTR